MNPHRKPSQGAWLGFPVQLWSFRGNCEQWAAVSAPGSSELLGARRIISYALTQKCRREVSLRGNSHFPSAIRSFSVLVRLLCVHECVLTMKPSTVTVVQGGQWAKLHTTAIKSPWQGVRGRQRMGGEVEGEIYSSDCSRYSIDWIQIDVYIMPLLCYVKLSIWFVFSGHRLCCYGHVVLETWPNRLEYTAKRLWEVLICEGMQHEVSCCPYLPALLLLNLPSMLPNW